MKRCGYCGKENIDAATNCAECGSADLRVADDRTKEQSIPAWLKEHLRILSPEEMQQDFVALTTCRTLPEADLLVSELENAGIPAFIPDEYLVQNVPFPSVFGYIRIQVVPRDYAEARELLMADASGPPPPPPPQN